MAISTRRSLVIGLGGTGLSTVYALKRKYRDTYGTTTPPGTRFLVIDTTNAQPASGISLEPSEFIHLSVGNAADVLNKNPFVRRWFPTEPAIPLGSINSGAGQLRPLGRLALFQNSDDVLNGINDKIQAVTQVPPGQTVDGFAIAEQQGILTHIVGSLSGGTGSGTLLDVAFICRHLLKDSMHKNDIMGYLLLPDIFVGRPATHNVEANAYAAMKELDYFMHKSADYQQEIEFRKGSKISCAQAPLDSVVVVNRQNSAGQSFGSVEDVAQHLALSIFLASGSLGQGAKNIVDNLRGYLGQIDFDGKSNFYCSIGLGELFFDRARHSQRVALEVASRLSTNAFRASSARATEGMVSDFMNAHQLVEHDADQLIDALRGDNPPRPPSVPDSVAKSELVQVVGGRAALVNSRDTLLSGIINERKADIEVRVLKAMDQRVDEMLSRPGGLVEAEDFVNTLIGHLRAFKDDMDREARSYREQREILKPLFVRLDEEAREIEASFLPSRGAVRDTLNRYRSLLEQEVEALLQTKRREAASGVYSVIIDRASQMGDRLARLRGMLGPVQQKLSAELEDARGSTAQTGPFTVSLPLPAEFIPEDPDPVAFLGWLRDTGRSLRSLSEMSVGEIVKCMKEYGAGMDKADRVGRMTIKEAFAGLSGEERSEYLKKLAQRAAALWTYDKTVVNAKTRLERIRILGVQSRENLPIDEKELQRAIGGEPEYAEVGDPERIYLYNVEVAVPGFAIGGMNGYKQKYDYLRRQRPFHIFPGFEDISRELIPSEGGEEALRLWSVGNASVFGCMSRSGSHYTLKSERHGRALDGHAVQLGQGRLKAYEAFVSNPEYPREVKAQVDKVVKQNGAASVAEQLRVHLEQLTGEGKISADQKVKDLIELEVKEIKGYITDLTTLG